VFIAERVKNNSALASVKDAAMSRRAYRRNHSLEIRTSDLFLLLATTMTPTHTFDLHATIAVLDFAEHRAAVSPAQAELLGARVAAIDRTALASPVAEAAVAVDNVVVAAVDDARARFASLFWRHRATPTIA
jgi:hypothetical protein